MRITALFFAMIAVLLAAIATHSATTLLPIGQQCFTNGSGPLVSGSVNMFQPNTVIPKQTWQDSSQNTLNTQPIQLDANGCAVIYGVGSYRQQVFDGPVISGNTSGNLVFDRITTDVSSVQQTPFWAGNASGTPNAIVLTDPGFTGADGSIINFLAAFTNTGATTISIASSGFTNIPVVKDTTGGPISLVGGEIIVPSGGVQNVVSVAYSSVQNSFHILNPVIQSASGATAPLCGGVGVVITNGSTPNSIVSIQADQIVLQTPNGLTINRSAVTLPNINITTGTSASTINGMDGESAGTNAWLYIWIIDNGAAPAGLVSAASGNGTAPVMPSGYTYKCRFGAMRVDGSGNLYRTRQNGSEAQWVVTPASNVTVLPVLTSTFGSYWTAQPITGVVPPTATRITVSPEMNVSVNPGSTNWSGTASAGVTINANYGTPTTSGRPPCSNQLTTGGAGSGETVSASSSIAIMCTFEMEGTPSNIYTGTATSGAGSVTSAVLSAVGWRDKVNAF